MKEGEQIDDGAEESDDDCEFDVEAHTAGAADDGEVEVERIDEERDQTGDEEDSVPSDHEIGVWFQDVIPPWHLLVQGQRFLKTAQARVRDVMHFSLEKKPQPTAQDNLGPKPNFFKGLDTNIYALNFNNLISFKYIFY